MRKLATFVALFAMVLATTPLALADVVETEVGVGAQPSALQPQICVYDRNVKIGILNVNGDALWADAPTINIFDLRISMYAFTGEQIEYVVVVRDPNGALDIGH